MSLSPARALSIIAPFVVLSAVVLPGPALAAEAPLTRARVVELARASPASRVAAAEVAVARATAGASGALSLENPVLAGAGGVRLNPDGSRPAAAMASLSWPVDLGGQRGARIDAAEAELRAAESAAEDGRRGLVLAALLQHALVLRDERHVALARARLALGDRLLAAAARRRKAGEAPEVDVALASLQRGRDAAAEAAARGTRDANLAALRVLLGLPAAADPERGHERGPMQGPLVPPDEPPPLAALLEALEQRTDLRAAAASLDAARARSAREQAARWPTVTVTAQYERDDGANIGMLGLAVPLPLLNANRSGAATAAAEVDVAAARSGAARAAAAGKVQELHARYVATRRALEALTPAAALGEKAAALAARGYELGENDLPSVLLVRREALETQAALLDAEHAHAAAKIELLVAAGRMPL
ncbi:TolC family protein [Sorangium sp. So ce1335]|uniref:TolC family protein n=1 Tax=Sorangium sp. So ce1335 TaxID=3133335 RepID=UPI003F5FADE7